jgi:hypothetical protein
MSNFPETYSANTGEVRIPAKLWELVNDELIDEESIQWIDQPIPIFFSPGATGLFLFGTVWTAFSIFWVCGAAGIGDMEQGINLNVIQLGQLALAAFGIPFVLIGFGLLSAPWWMYRFAKRTVYAITNHRAIIVQGGFSGLTVTSYYPNDIVYISRNQRAKGRGDILFRYGGTGGEHSTTGQGFENIRNVKEVERILQDLKRTKSSGNEQ